MEITRIVCWTEAHVFEKSEIQLFLILTTAWPRVMNWVIYFWYLLENCCNTHPKTLDECTNASNIITIKEGEPRIGGQSKYHSITNQHY